MIEGLTDSKLSCSIVRVTDQPNKISVWVLAALKNISLQIKATGVPAAIVALGIIVAWASVQGIPLIEFVVLNSSFTVVSFGLIIAEFRKGRPVRPITIVKTIPNRHTELCALIRQFLYHDRIVPSEILNALENYDENGKMRRVDDGSTIRQEIADNLRE